MHLCSSGILTYDFFLFFGIVFVWFWYEGNAGLVDEFGSFPFFLIFWNSLGTVYIFSRRTSVPLVFEWFPMKAVL